MKSKALLTAVLLAATNFAWAQGGITPDNFAQHYEVADVGITSVNEMSYIDLNELRKPSTGPAYRGASSGEQFVFDLNAIGKPSNGPAYHGAS